MAATTAAGLNAKLPSARKCNRKWRSRQHSRGVLGRVVVRSGSSPNDGRENASDQQPAGNVDKTIKGLDAILGSEKGEEEEHEGNKDPEESNEGLGSDKIEISRSALNQLKEAERQRYGKDSEEAERITRMLDKLDEATSKASEKGSNEDSQRVFLEEMRDTLKEAAQGDSIPKEDVDAFKDSAFGINTFWVTGVERSSVFDGGTVFTGNLRVQEDAVFEQAERANEELFGDKYTVFMVPERDALPITPSSDAESFASRDRVAFVLIRKEKVTATGTPTWQYGISGVLGVLTFLSMVQIGLVTQVSKLPPEVVRYLTNPQLPEGQIPEELLSIDPTPFVLGALPIAGALAVSAGVHELAHWSIAKLRNMRINIPFFVPNGQVGTFGAVTQLQEPARTRNDLFDFSIAGPAAGMACGLLLFAYGLAVTVSKGDASSSSETLVNVPYQVFNGSLLLGNVVKSFISSDLANSSVNVHPFLLAGWCVLTTNALNLLPVGKLDGGRMAQTAFGNLPLAFTSFATYLGLALGLLGGNLSTAWGLFVLIAQRDPEAPPRNDATPVDQERQIAAATAIILAVAILLPGAGGGASTMLEGGQQI